MRLDLQDRVLGLIELSRSLEEQGRAGSVTAETHRLLQQVTVEFARVQAVLG